MAARSRARSTKRGRQPVRRLPRWSLPAALAALLVLWWLLGPLVPLLVTAALLLAFLPVRRRLPRLPAPTTRGVLRTSAGGVAGVLVVAAVAWLVPDGRLPVPSGSGAWVTPGYTGRPVVTRPLTSPPPPRPHLAATSAAGPTGLSVEVDSGWYGLEQCARLAQTSGGRLVASCAGPGSPRLRVVDADGLHPLATKDLPSGCGHAPFFLDDQDRVVAATAARELVTVLTADGAGQPDLTTLAVVDLADVVPAGDCVATVLPDHDGRTWWASEAGMVGFVAGDGEVRSRDLGDPVATELVAGPDGAVYLATTTAHHRLRAGREEPVVDWRTPYDAGSGRKTGQPLAGTGATPVLLPGDDGALLAVTDNANPRMHVGFLRVVDGSEVCRVEVFEDDASASSVPLVAVARAGVVVTNTHGYDSPWRTVLGRRPAGGLARVDVVDGACTQTWASAEVVPGAGPVVAAETGVVLAWTKRKSWLLADAWYLTALDARTGRTAWAVRGGRGVGYDAPGSALLLGADASAYVGTLGGLVRVRDRQPAARIGP